MTAYYNEFDLKAAAWLRQLINNGDIAEGIVDERSVTDVQAIDLKSYTQHHFFAGIGVWSYALRNAGWSDDTPVCTASLPCQPFSVAGEQLGKKMNDICSHTSSNSLSSASLTLSLVSRLKAQLDTGGLMIYKQQWKQKVTPLDMLFWAHTASTPRTKDRDCSGWPTPSVRDMKGGYRGGRIRNGKISTDTLDVTAQLAGWATPNTMDTLPARNQEAMKRQFSTARKNRTAPANLREQVHPHLYPVSLAESIGSTAKTENAGQLNPALSRWLMGLPEAWCIAAVQSTQMPHLTPEQ